MRSQVCRNLPRTAPSPAPVDFVNSIPGEVPSVHAAPRTSDTAMHGTRPAHDAADKDAAPLSALRACAPSPSRSVPKRPIPAHLPTVASMHRARPIFGLFPGLRHPPFLQHGKITDVSSKIAALLRQNFNIFVCGLVQKRKTDSIFLSYFLHKTVQIFP